ncbi:MAG: polysaccharide deacetylase family protein [Candidatus Oleimicrobiaceae bacterium]
MNLGNLSPARRAQRLLSRALVLSGAAELWYRAVTARRLQFRVLGYHRVCEQPQPAGTIEEALTVPVAEFVRQMAYIRRGFTALPLEEFGTFQRKPWAFSKPPLAVTFDDGYRDNVTLVQPILGEYEIPATIFVTTGYLGQRRLFWWNELSSWVWHAVPGRYSLVLGGRRRTFRVGTSAERRRLFWWLFRTLCALPEKAKEEHLAHIKRVLCPEGESHAQGLEILSGDELAQAQGKNLRFGAHTVHHVVLTKVPPEQAQREIIDSIAHLKLCTGAEVTSFAYPVGDAASFDPHIQGYLAQAGIRYAVTTIKGANGPDQNPLALRRTLIDGGDDFCTFVCKVVGLFDVLRR